MNNIHIIAKKRYHFEDKMYYVQSFRHIFAADNRCVRKTCNPKIVQAHQKIV